MLARARTPTILLDFASLLYLPFPLSPSFPTPLFSFSFHPGRDISGRIIDSLGGHSFVHWFVRRNKRTVDVRPSQDTSGPSSFSIIKLGLTTQFLSDAICSLSLSLSFPFYFSFSFLAVYRRSFAISSGTTCKPLCNFSNLSPRVCSSPWRILRITFPIGNR